MSNHRTPNEILKIYTRRLRRGEHITAAEVYRELSPQEWAVFSMASIRVKTPGMKLLMNNAWALQDREIDASFNVCPWADDKLQFIADIKNLAPETLAKYNKRKARIRGLMGRKWINWCL